APHAYDVARSLLPVLGVVLDRDDAGLCELATQRVIVELEPARVGSTNRRECLLGDEADNPIPVPPQQLRAGRMLVAFEALTILPPPSPGLGVRRGAATRVFQEEPPRGKPVAEHAEKARRNRLLCLLHAMFGRELPQRLAMFVEDRRGLRQ